jgi:pilus assembly protein TadC
MKISEMSNGALTSLIASFRVLSMLESEAIQAMEELHLRKINGSDFDFKSEIDIKVKSFPSPTIDKKEKSILQSIFSMKDIKNV